MLSSTGAKRDHSLDCLCSAPQTVDGASPRSMHRHLLDVPTVEKGGGFTVSRSALSTMTPSLRSQSARCRRSRISGGTPRLGKHEYRYGKVKMVLLCTNCRTLTSARAPRRVCLRARSAACSSSLMEIFESRNDGEQPKRCARGGRCVGAERTEGRCGRGCALLCSNGSRPISGVRDERISAASAT